MSTTRIAFKVSGTVQGLMRNIQASASGKASLHRTAKSMTSYLINCIQHSDFTQKCATSYDLKGFVRNTTCGRVSPQTFI
ncbi:unnamed protein product [Penicillium olsonii]|nr:unnamed protein product [Penicillium olsonii]